MMHQLTTTVTIDQGLDVRFTVICSCGKFQTTGNRDYVESLGGQHMLLTDPSREQLSLF